VAAPKSKTAELCQRVTREAGSHALTIAPAGTGTSTAKSSDGALRWAVDFHSALNAPPTAILYELPTMTARRVLADNAELVRRVAALAISPAQFLKVPMPDGTLLDAWRIVPPGFDSTRKYPVLMFVYGGPSAPTVTDEWGGSTYLWHQMLAQRGYIVISADNRGAAWRGRDWRKGQMLRMGLPESQDQMDVARWLGRQSWGDSTRIGIWGWSYGGFLTALTASRGGDLFKAALCVAPVTDWRLYDTIYTERYMRTPRENEEGYRLSSPQTYVEGLRARFLLVHGTGDDNVHVQNSLQLANRFEAAGKLFTMLLYPNRTHSLAEGGVTPQLRESFTRFILENL
jgi:dipeptidyl-peptidase-4